MSFSFEQVKALKEGDIVWEASQYGSIQIVLTEDPRVTTSKDGYEQVAFTAELVKSDSGRVINYLLTDRHMHYGPKLYNENPYITAAELAAVREFMKTPPGMVSSKSSHSDSCNRQKGGSFCDCGFS